MVENQTTEEMGNLQGGAFGKTKAILKDKGQPGSLFPNFYICLRTNYWASHASAKRKTFDQGQSPLLSVPHSKHGGI